MVEASELRTEKMNGDIRGAVLLGSMIDCLPSAEHKIDRDR